MIHAEHSFSLPYEAELVFDYLCNPLNDLHWQSSCAAVELLDGHHNVGGGYKIRFDFLGRQMNFRCQITARETNQRYRFKVVEGPFIYEGGYDFTITDKGVDVLWQFAAEPGGFFGILPGVLLRKVLISQVERDLVKLNRLLPDYRLQPA